MASLVPVAASGTNSCQGPSVDPQVMLPLLALLGAEVWAPLEVSCGRMGSTRSVWGGGHTRRPMSPAHRGFQH